MGKISVYLDEEHQIIRQNFDGNLDEDMVQRFLEESRAAAARLKDPKKIRILGVADSLGKGSPEARRQLLRNLDHDDVYKVALLGKNPFMNVAISFFLAIKPSNKIRMFGNEDDALRWLME
ncbi:MAG TPA: STAS/SEC14 domain-containing protein [Chitinivibrionales bacterium]|nr:STAS/SEC14 domain-containing protein [Chitinivibrionales bacterium]